MATKKTDTAPDGQDLVDAPVDELCVGELVRHVDAPHRVALLVGFDDDGHPLVVDLPAARVHQPGVVRA